MSGYQRATRIGVALIGAEIAMAAFFGLAGVTGHMAGTAYAETPTVTVTVDGVDYPLCATEDCSDVPGQIGVWRNDGRAWLIIGVDTYPITY